MVGKNIMRCVLFVFLVAVILAIYSILNSNPCKIQPFSRNVFPTNASSPDADSNSTPQELLKSNSLITVKLIHSGDLKAPFSSAINLHHPACSGMKDKIINVPIFAYLVHHEKFGYFLIDSGSDFTYIHNPYGRMKGLILRKVVPETILKPEDAIETRIKDIRKDIKGVFFTHLHPDHTSGLPALPDHLLYFAGKGEKPISFKWFLEPNHFKESDTLFVFDFTSKESQTTPLGQAIDVFGDQSMWAIFTPGHTKGHTSYLVNSIDHPILIAGDACCINRSMEIGVGPSGPDTALGQRTFDKMRNFLKHHHEVKIWFGHDFPK